ncbi:hypothetical protein LCGC14_2197390, partial [marine sediment metagenome]
MVLSNERQNYGLRFKKLKNWFVLYSIGLFIFIGMVIGIFFI